MNKAVLGLLVLLATTGDAAGTEADEVIVRGVTVYGMDREELFPLLGGDSLHRYITILPSGS